MVAGCRVRPDSGELLLSCVRWMGLEACMWKRIQSKRVAFDRPSRGDERRYRGAGGGMIRRHYNLCFAHGNESRKEPLNGSLFICLLSYALERLTVVAREWVASHEVAPAPQI